MFDINRQTSNIKPGCHLLSLFQIKSTFPHWHSLELEIPEGQLVAVLGQVGSGKSSLLSTLLGELQQISGRLQVNVSIIHY